MSISLKQIKKEVKNIKAEKKIKIQKRKKLKMVVRQFKILKPTTIK